MRRVTAVVVVALLTTVSACVAAATPLRAASDAASATLTRTGATYTLTVVNTATTSDAPALTAFSYLPIAGFKLVQGQFCTLNGAALVCHNLFLSAGASDAVALASSGSPGTGANAGVVTATFADGGMVTLSVANKAGGSPAAPAPSSQAVLTKTGRVLHADEEKELSLLDQVAKDASAGNRTKAEIDAFAAQAEARASVADAKAFKTATFEVKPSAVKIADAIEGDDTETYDRITDTRMRMTVSETPHFTPAKYAPELAEAEDADKTAARLTEQVM